MKTSFYFLLWIIIYPLLDILDIPWIDSNAFLVALFIVWGLSWVLNRFMPKTLRYERTAQALIILEEAFKGDSRALHRRLSHRATLDFITSVYFGVTFIFILFSMVRGSADDWIALAIFGFFAFATISSAVKLNKAAWALKKDPTPEKCARLVESIYGYDYLAYRNARITKEPENMLPERPPHFTTFQVFSLVIAIICTLLGLYYFVSSLMILIISKNPASISWGVMYFLYSSLAVYFGIKDTATCILFFRARKRSSFGK